PASAAAHPCPRRRSSDLDIPELKRAFAAGLDIHAATASEMFGVPLEQMDAETRRRAKAINFGIIYGISAFGLAAQLNIPQSEAGDRKSTRLNSSHVKIPY